MDTDGFAIVPGLIPRALIAPAVKAIKERLKVALKGYKIELGQDCEGLNHATAKFHLTPAGWPGLKFGCRHMRGWIKPTGTGRIFDDWKDHRVEAVQEACRDLAASLLQVPPESLHRVHERCSVKVPGCQELGAHLDRNRLNTVQILVALSGTNFLLWPGSHQHDIGSGKDGFYSLSREETAGLPRPRIEVVAGAGDVCVMVGGKLVHGSVAVTSGVRIMTYAHFETSLAQAPTMSQGIATAEQPPPSKPKIKKKKSDEKPMIKKPMIKKKKKSDEKVKLRKQILNFPKKRVGSVAKRKK